MKRGAEREEDETLSSSLVTENTNSVLDQRGVGWMMGVGEKQKVRVRTE